MLQVNEVVALVLACISALFLFFHRDLARRSQEFRPLLFAFGFVFLALVATNLEAVVLRHFFLLLEHFALAAAGMCPSEEQE
jgi:hypothetical protein